MRGAQPGATLVLEKMMKVNFLLAAQASQLTAFLYFYSMADVHDKKTRSYNVSQIRSRNTKPEMLVRKFSHAISFLYLKMEMAFTTKPN